MQRYKKALKNKFRMAVVKIVITFAAGTDGFKVFLHFYHKMYFRNARLSLCGSFH